MDDNYMDVAIAYILGEMGLEDSDIDEKQRKNVEEFVRISIECDEDIVEGIDHQIPMTYSLYRRTVDALQKMGAERTLKEFYADFGQKFSM